MGRMTSHKTLIELADKYLHLSSVHLLCNYLIYPDWKRFNLGKIRRRNNVRSETKNQNIQMFYEMT